MTSIEQLESKARHLKNRHDFLCDAYIQGMCDGDEVTAAGRTAKEAERELADAFLAQTAEGE